MGGAAGWTYLDFPRLEKSKQLYTWPVIGHVRRLFNYLLRHRYDSAVMFSESLI
jgi:hypothetical protein